MGEYIGRTFRESEGEHRIRNQNEKANPIENLIKNQGGRRGKKSAGQIKHRENFVRGNIGGRNEEQDDGKLTNKKGYKRIP